MRILSIDLGLKRTGLAFADSEVGIPLALDTISHQTPEECFEILSEIVVRYSIEKIVVGNPLLPSGEIGAQAEVVDDMVDLLSDLNIPIELVDERYTTDVPSGVDPDAAAACRILESVLKRMED